jgi:hypothetical protein
LLSSFDRVNACLPGTATMSWMHTDQSGAMEGLACVQGYLDINGTGVNDGGLQVAVGSHEVKITIVVMCCVWLFQE